MTLPSQLPVATARSVARRSSAAEQTSRPRAVSRRPGRSVRATDGVDRGGVTAAGRAGRCTSGAGTKPGPTSWRWRGRDRAPAPGLTGVGTASALILYSFERLYVERLCDTVLRPTDNCRHAVEQMFDLRVGAFYAVEHKPTTDH